MVAALLEHGAEVGRNSHYMSYVVVSANEQTRFEAMDALQIATKNGHRDVIKMLKAHGA
jgi:ankyrin repeat protein